MLIQPTFDVAAKAQQSDAAPKTGMGGHQSAAAETTTWLTPPYIIEALGTFDLDPCAAPDPKPWPTATTHYTAPEQDGLELPWFGRCWVNPPYGDETKLWLRKLVRHGQGTALIFARTETATFFSTVWERATAALFLRNRLCFHLPDGSLLRADGRKLSNAGAPSVLCAYGIDDAERLYHSGLDGAFVPLTRPVMIQVALFQDEPMPNWRTIVREALQQLGGTAKLRDIYDKLERHPKVSANPNWRAKIRQTIGRIGLPRTDVGQYSLAI